MPIRPERVEPPQQRLRTQPLSDQSRVFDQLVSDLATGVSYNIPAADAYFNVLSNHSYETVNLSTSSFIRRFQKKLKGNKVVVTKADMGNSVVLMSRDDYATKIKELLDSSGCTVASVNLPFSFPEHVQEIRFAVLKSSSKKFAIC